jgi:nicotinamide riboside kinase
MSAPRLICIIGAESTGKTTLAKALAGTFQSPWVPEYLRTFCDLRGRTPTQGEQSLILETQVVDELSARTRARADAAPFVFCDTAPLLTAIYSEFVFADTSLYARARTLHGRYALTLVLAPDIAWIADGMQRDGEHVRAPITERIISELSRINARVVHIGGQSNDRLHAATEAVRSLLQGKLRHPRA